MEIFNRLKEKFKLIRENKFKHIIKVTENEKYRQKMIAEMKEYRKRMEEEDVFFMLGRDEAYELFSDPARDSKNLYGLYELYKGWDDYGHLPKNVGIMFEDLLADQSHYVGIHRSDSIGQFGNVLEDPILKDVFTYGLRNNGDLFSSGVVQEGYIHPKKTCTPCNNLLTLIMLAKTSRKHGDKASIITCIPREYVNDEYEIINNSGAKIYIEDPEGNVNIRPEFIAGCVYQDHGNCTFYIKEDLEKQKNR